MRFYFFSAQVLGFMICSNLLASENQAKELQLVHRSFGIEDRELSGFTGVKGQLYAVDDGDHRIFKLIPEDSGRFRFKSVLNFKDVSGYKPYKSKAKQQAKEQKLGAWLDLEGISHCPKKGWYLINERLRDIIWIDAEKKWHVLNWQKQNVDKLFSGGANAGFEAIAVDCEREIVWVAKERGPRFIVGIDLKKGTVLRTITLIPSNRSGQQVINYQTGLGLMEIPDDIAGMAFENDYLYILERNTYEIAKFSLNLGRVVSRVSFYLSAARLYEHAEPYGLAEALWIDKEQIIVGFDHNGGLLSSSTSKEAGLNGSFPTILKFSRPREF